MATQLDKIISLYDKNNKLYEVPWKLVFTNINMRYNILKYYEKYMRKYIIGNKEKKTITYIYNNNNTYNYPFRHLCKKEKVNLLNCKESNKYISEELYVCIIGDINYLYKNISYDFLNNMLKDKSILLRYINFRELLNESYSNDYSLFKFKIKQIYDNSDPIFKHIKNKDILFEYMHLCDDLTWDFIEKNLNKGWNWNDISYNKVITWDIINKYPNIPWNNYMISVNENISYDIVKNNPIFDWKYEKMIIYNPNITIEIIKENIKVWKVKYKHALLKNLNITWDIVKEIFDENDYRTNDIITNQIRYNLSCNKNMTFDIINENSNFPWCWNIISSRQLTWDIIDKYPNIKWQYDILSENISLTNILELVQKYDNKLWNYDILSANPNISLEEILNNPEYKWNYNNILLNPLITLKEIERNKNIIQREYWNYRNKNLLINNYMKNPYFSSDIYKKKMTKKMHNRIYNELIKVSCTPKRLHTLSCMDIEEYNFLQKMFD
jgi:hypothetical protein